MKYEAIVVGVSSGGMNAMKMIFPSLPLNFSIPMIIVQHISSQSDNYWISMLNQDCKLYIKEAEEKEKITKGVIYISPANYHLLIEKEKTFSLTIDEKVNFARPSIDVLFESAADAYKKHLIGIILTGANQDGALGLKKIKENGGLTIVQDPKTAESSYMPSAAIESCNPHHILSLDDIIDLLIHIDKKQSVHNN